MTATMADVVHEINNYGDMLREFVGTQKSHNQAFDARLLELEQKIVRGRHGGGSYSSSMGGGGRGLGAAVVGSSQFRDLIASPGRKGRALLSLPSELAAITTIQPTGGRDTLVAPDFQPAPVAPPTRRLTIRAMLNPGRTSSNAVSYVRETGFDNQADFQVSEGQPKEESNLTFEMLTAPVCTLAHYVEASKQILDDAPVLAGYIDGRLRYGLSFREEQVLLFGTGENDTPNGLVTQATAYSAPFTPTSPNMLDTLGTAIAQAEAAEYPVTAIIMNPVDWRKAILLKDGEDRYLSAGPFGMNTPRLFGIDVIPTNAMPEDSWLVGSLGYAARLRDREDVTVELSTEAEFKRNIVVIRCESRFALTVERPESLIAGSFGLSS